MRAVLGATTVLIGITGPASAADMTSPQGEAVPMLLIGAGLLIGSFFARRLTTR